MRIGLIAPSPIPFTVGGAEKFYWGIQSYINKNTTHQCELIKIPVKEDNFWNLIRAYYKFYAFDASHFDSVITCKYPAWMIKHENHHIYMLHCLRGLYDMYDQSKIHIPADFKAGKIKNILNYMEKPLSSPGVLFEMLFELEEDKKIPKEAYAFPGPFIKKIIGFFDKQAMEGVKSFSAISKTVAERKEYFPPSATVNVIYPPSNLENFKEGNYGYFLAVSRLDEAKRIRTIIEAYLKTGVNVPLKIVGTGPLMDELKEISKGDPRIELVGYVGDKDLTDYYAGALAVIFIPYEEDYGLVTLEAMMCGKPVITFKDSGGVLEFVEDGKTGFVCEPAADALKGLIEKAALNTDLMREMGTRAKKKAELITWENTVQSLFGVTGIATAKEQNNYKHSYNIIKTNNNQKNKRKKITVSTTYPIYPPMGGGQNRIFYLYKELARYYDIEIISLTGSNDTGFRKEIAPNLFENRIPKSKKFEEKEKKMQDKIGIFATDLAMLYFYKDISEYVDTAKKYSLESEVLIASHPYTYPLLSLAKRHERNFLIYESHNVEYELKKQMMEKNNESEKIANYLFETEKEACLYSDLITFCSMEDAGNMQKIYGLNLKPDKVLIVPNGVDLDSVIFTPPAVRKEIKKKLGLENEKIIFFMGSWHKPNIEAADKIIAAARKLPEYRFIVLGGVGDHYKTDKAELALCPDNVGFTGLVEDDEKFFYLSFADLALNPIISGSGTNLKILDYMAAGIPLLSSYFGARGVISGISDSAGIPENKMIGLTDMENFPDAISEYLNSRDDAYVYNARKYVESHFSWKSIAKNFKNRLDEYI